MVYRELIEQFHSGRHTKLKWARFRALIYCLSPLETSRCLLDMLSAEADIYVRNALTQKLLDDILTGGWQPYHETMSRQILAAYHRLPLAESLPHGYVMGQIAILESVPQMLRHDIVRALLSSDYASRRQLGYQVFDEVEVTDFTAELETAWLKYGDTACARLIAKFAPKILERNFTSLFDLQDKQTIIPLFLNVDLTTERLTALLRADGITFAYICAKKGLHLTDNDAAALWQQYAQDKRAGLLLWCFGRLKLQAFLTSLQLDIKHSTIQKLQVPKKSHRLNV
jgi:hypothetical protein